jgi:hypothetical protein
VVPDRISVEEKRYALERVIKSRTFTRSDQLRSFLQYICEAEIEGREQELNEYALGVSVLGRPADYSPAEDSCVRTRAYELRHKLRSYYQLEAPDDPIQIEIRKGAYIPQFQRTVASRRNPPDPAETASAPSVASLPSPAVPEQARRARRPAVLAFLFIALAGLVFLVIKANPDRPVEETEAQGWTPEVAALWRPFVDSGAPLLISFETRLFFYSGTTGLVVRDYQTNQLTDLAASKPLAGFRARMGVEEMRETRDYADFGAVHAAFLLGRLLGPRQRQIGLKDSGALGWDDIWNSNLVFIGKPNLHPSIRHVLKSGDFVDELDRIRNLHPRAGESAEYLNAETHGAGEKYALITKSPGPQPGRHMMILGGAGAELSWALAEYVTNPVRVKELASHLCSPAGKCPEAFQVVIQAAFESNVPIRIRYVTHRVSRSPGI